MTSAEKKYDTIIVGAGPSGLTCAWLAAKRGEKVLLLERASHIGGVHRVNREISGVAVPGENLNSSGENKVVTVLFGEHGPRIYSTSYICFRKLLTEMGSSFDKFFAPYEFGVTTIGAKNASQFKWKEIYSLAKRYFWKTPDMSVLEFCRREKFSPESIDYIDRLCRLTDGAGADRYRISQFLNLIDQQSLYTLSQPKIANDRGLFKFWRKKLEEVGVDILLDADVSAVITDSAERKVRGVEVAREEIFRAEKVLLCIPPNSILRLLGEKKLTKYFGVDKNWVKQCSYDKYINVTFMWRQDVLKGIPRVWGFPASKWGVAYIVLTDTIRGENFDTIISAAITKSDQLPKNLSRADLIAGVFDQLKISYPHLPNYDAATTDPEKFETLDSEVIGNADGIVLAGSAYINAAGYSPLPSRGYVRGLFTVGPQNGNSEYTFTSLESAISNAMHFYGENRPKLWTVKKLLLFVFSAIIGFIVGYLLVKK